jgi:hypothetical protein
MAQTGFTPIQLYYSSTATNVPLAADLANGELAINITDGKLFYKDNASAVQVIGWKVVPATAGGTGQTSYAVGDLLYANTTTTLDKLADVATGNALISGGVSTAPAWGKIGLTTHVSGTLPTANGGTNLTSFTANGVVYASSTSALATSSNFQYDGTNVIVALGKSYTTYTANYGIGTPDSDGLQIFTGDLIRFGSRSGGTFTERARIDSSGNFIVGKTTASDATTGVRISSGGLIVPARANGEAIASVRLDSDGSVQTFFRGTTGGSVTQVGSISVTTTATAYNTSSDYRLKNTIAPMTGALAKVAQLKPVTYKWNADGSDGEGFIAHELAEVIPHAVNGEKDGTRIEEYEVSPAVSATYDENGNEITPAIPAVMGGREVPSYQGIDTSFLVATLTAAIQEQTEIINSLTARIVALESK